MGVRTGPLFAEILVVDDDSDFVRTMRLVLQSAGYIVRSAPSGEVALEMVRAKPPDLILLDVSLPGMDGYQVARHLRANPGLPFIPIVIVTAHAQVDIATGLNAGADEFIGKPVRHAELLARVRAMLRLKMTTDELHELKETAHNLLKTYMPAHVAEALIANPSQARPGGQRREVTILFADLEGFTASAEHMPPEQVLDRLNAAMSTMTDAIIMYGGTVDKFIGDGVMAIFNAPLDQPDHAYQACQAAIEIQRHLKAQSDTTPWRVNLGLHTGEAVIGNVGSPSLLNYTAIGDAVNLAKRLEEMARGGQILISHETLARAHYRVAAQWVGERTVPGRQSPVQVYMLNFET